MSKIKATLDEAEWEKRESKDLIYSAHTAELRYKGNKAIKNMEREMMEMSNYLRSIK